MTKCYHEHRINEGKDLIGLCMQLFFSYAHGDRPLVEELLQYLSVYQIWHDDRIFMGERWWDRILKQLAACEGLVFCISPRSLSSAYCMKEYEIAYGLGKHIFPIFIADCPLPDTLAAMHYVDMRNGITARAISELHSAIYVAKSHKRVPRPVPRIDKLQPGIEPGFRPTMVYRDITIAMEKRNYDRAVYLIDLAFKYGLVDPLIDLSKLRQQAQAALQASTVEQARDASYDRIRKLFQSKSTLSEACASLDRFLAQYPGHDPDKLRAKCQPLIVPEIEYCDIPGGDVLMHMPDGRRVWRYLDPYRISKYPITVAQYQIFVEAADGYVEPRWWDFSRDACLHRQHQPKPMPANLTLSDHPRVNITWYDAVAYCNWLSARTGQHILLPTEAQWQRAAQGDDPQRRYPWGKRFDRLSCNCREYGHRNLTNVKRFLRSASSFGVMDMAGNAWEWCRNGSPAARQGGDPLEANKRAVRGGCYSSHRDHLLVYKGHYLAPSMTGGTFGFRIVIEEK